MWADWLLNKGLVIVHIAIPLYNKVEKKPQEQDSATAQVPGQGIKPRGTSSVQSKRHLPIPICCCFFRFFPENVKTETQSFVSPKVKTSHGLGRI
jgi:hypothetical protein